MEDEREEELSSLTAIFPELHIDPLHPFNASIDLPVAPTVPLALVLPAPVDGVPPAPHPTSYNTSLSAEQPASEGTTHPNADEIHELSYLPPIQVKIELPDGYPSETPPISRLNASPNWVPEDTLIRLQDECPKLWEEYGRGQVVFAYIDFLQQAAESGFDIDKRVKSGLDVSQEIGIALLDFDSKEKRKKFEQETFDCGVCLEPKKGTSCYRLSRCQHVFCVQCLQDFYNSCITEGDIRSVKCMAPDCGKVEVAHNGTAAPRKRKSPRTLTPNELLQIPLEPSVVRRYVELKRKKKLESDKSTIYCPRTWCQGPARSDKYPKSKSLTDFPDYPDSESDVDSEAGQSVNSQRDEKSTPTSATSGDRLAICENCSYAFCRVCQQGWHGEFARCWPRSVNEISAEEKASYEYIRLHTSPCPTCSSPVQKTHGCNHMQCFQCNTHFCYLCSAWLDAQNPYQHFNVKESSCYMRLWELEEGDEGEGNIRFEGGRGWEAAIAAAEEAEAAEAQARDGVVEENANGNQNPDNRQVLDGNRQGQQGGALAAQQPQQRLARPQDNIRGEGDNARRRVPQEPGNGPLIVAAMHDMRLDGVVGNGDYRGPDREAALRDRRGLPRNQPPGRVGLQRFLEMVQADEEDDWDSDELDDELDEDGAVDDRWAIPER